ncbi:MAG TPA: carboxypeptidase regulatory-like domain-containing protein [Nitrospiria bacterium]|nr:carboxypeptidase regulatory-like domain-containing protein [Nitrospiria bacterium]
MKLLFCSFAIVILIANAPIAHAGGTVTGTVQIPGKTDLENILVYIEDVKGSFPVPKRRPEMNHVNLQFQPGRLAVMKGGTVDFPNSDPVLHSAFSISKSNPFELGIYGRGFEKFVHFQNPGLVEIFCHIHSHMHAFVMVVDNPFFGVTKKDGSFTIPDVPGGTYHVKAWVDPSTNDSKPVTVGENENVTLNFTLAPKN